MLATGGCPGVHSCEYTSVVQSDIPFWFPRRGHFKLALHGVYKGRLLREPGWQIKGKKFVHCGQILAMVV